ncbi:hypothetical protein GDO81_002091 [Engystomops pustulosus]|uniref:Uncharacterized protein n=1 Tax=Engystomops pustulosus TaxID=76066 RepID=A0AAV7DHP2_ENGPU|nr:hypothetical protein GDO81_002091 [Engystomops pustulosus]
MNLSSNICLQLMKCESQEYTALHTARERSPETLLSRCYRGLSVCRHMHCLFFFVHLTYLPLLRTVGKFFLMLQENI